MNADSLVFQCGPSTATCKCTCGIEDVPHVCEHTWDGPEEHIEYESGALSVSATCSRCGLTALAHSLWCSP
jgi:hypothetical protein